MGKSLYWEQKYFLALVYPYFDFEVCWATLSPGRIELAGGNVCAASDTSEPSDVSGGAEHTPHTSRHTERWKQERQVTPGRRELDTNSDKQLI